MTILSYIQKNASLILYVFGREEIISSCGSDYVARRTPLNLISAVLAGYCAKVCQEYYKDHVQETERRAPIIAVRYADGAYWGLEQVMRSLAVNTSFFDYLLFGLTTRLQIDRII